MDVGERIDRFLEQNELRRTAYATWKASGDSALDDLGLRAAAQHASAIGDFKAERQIDDRLAARGQR